MLITLYELAGMPPGELPNGEELTIGAATAGEAIRTVAATRAAAAKAKVRLINMAPYE
ncbi:MAG: hypothetical protein ABI632_09625 [Pseudolysinimonas sp.]